MVEEFIGKLKAAMDNLVLGDGMKDGVSQGPIINKSQFDKVTYSGISDHSSSRREWMG